MMIKRFFFGLFTLLLLCVSCDSSESLSEGLVYSKELLENAEDADVAFREIIRNNRIIFVGEDAHIYRNSSIFLQENIQVMYDEGIRYIFSEGGEPLDDTSIPLAGTFYPWLYTGGRYEEGFYGALEKFNQNKTPENQIKVISLEKGRTSFRPGEMNIGDLYNYRSSHMAEVMLKEMENIDPNDKVLVLAGDMHGATKPLYTGFSNTEMFDWKPLGAYLKESYGDDYFAVRFSPLSDGVLRYDDLDEKLQLLPEWDDLPSTAKFLTPEDMELWVEELPFGFERVFDGYIVEKEAITGIPFEYAVHDEYVLEKMLAHLEYLDERVSLLNGEYDYYGDVDTYYLLDDYLRVVYYIKLYFGDQFNYDLWSPATTLKAALADFRKQTEGTALTDKVLLEIPNDEGLRDFKAHMQTFYSTLSQSNDEGDNKALLERGLNDMFAAQELIPQDLWASYWFALMHTRAEEYDTALDYWKKLLAEPLVKSMHIYLEALEYASFCANESGQSGLAEEYQEEKAQLWNEHSIDASKIFLLGG